MSRNQVLLWVCSSSIRLGDDWDFCQPELPLAEDSADGVLVERKVRHTVISFICYILGMSSFLNLSFNPGTLNGALRIGFRRERAQFQV